MTDISKSLLEVLKLTGGTAIPVDFSKQDDIMGHLWDAGRAARLVTAEAREATEKYTDWQQLDRLHPDHLKASNFTQTMLETMFIAGLASSKSLHEIREGAGLTTTNIKAVINSRHRDYEERRDGRDSMLIRSRWWIAILLFFYALIWGVSERHPERVGGTEELLLYVLFSVPLLIFGWIALRPQQDESVNPDKDFSETRHHERATKLLCEENDTITEKAIFLRNQASQTARLFKVGSYGAGVSFVILVVLFITPTNQNPRITTMTEKEPSVMADKLIQLEPGHRDIPPPVSDDPDEPIYRGPPPNPRPRG